MQKRIEVLEKHNNTQFALIRGLVRGFRLLAPQVGETAKRLMHLGPDELDQSHEEVAAILHDVVAGIERAEAAGTGSIALDAGAMEESQTPVEEPRLPRPPRRAKETASTIGRKAKAVNEEDTTEI